MLLIIEKSCLFEENKEKNHRGDVLIWSLHMNKNHQNINSSISW